MKTLLLEAILMNECQRFSIEQEDVTFACQEALHHFSQGHSFTESINFGLGIAESFSEN